MKAAFNETANKVSNFPRRLTLLYVLFGIAWTLFITDYMHELFADPMQADQITVLGSLAFVAASAAFIFLLSKHHSRLLDLKRLEILSAQERFKSLFDKTEVGVYLVGPEQSFLEFNPCGLKILGRTRQEMVSLKLGQVFADPFGSELTMARARLLECGAYSGFWKLRRGKTEEFQAEVNLSSLLDGSMLLILRDVTEQRRAEQALLRSEANLRQAQRLANVGSWEYDYKTHKVQASDTFYEILGYEPGSVTITRELMLGHLLEKDRAYVEALDLARVGLSNPQNEEFSCRIRRKDGVVRNLFVRRQYHLDENGTLRWGWGIVQDITESVVREAELKLLWQAVEHSHASIVVTDTELNILYTNPFFSRVSGYAPLELKGRKVSLTKSGEHPPEFYKSMWRVLGQGQTWRGELLNRAKNGRLFWEDVSIAPVKDGKGQVVNYIAVKEDISERKRREESLSRALLEFEALFQNSSVGIVELRGRGWVNRANNRMYEILGCGAQDLIGLSVRRFFSNRQNFRDFLRESREVLSAGGVFKYEGSFQGHLGRKFWAEVSGRAVNPQDFSQGLIWVVDDVSKRKQAEDVRRDMERIMRHDLKSPLSGIIGLPEMLLEDSNLTEDQKENLRRIRKNGLNLLEQINSSLELFRLESGSYVYSPAKFDARQLIDETVKNFAPLAAAYRVEISTVYPVGGNGSSGRINFFADRMLCRIALSNLLKNAIEASPFHGKVEIRLDIGAGGSISLENQGEIPKEIQPRFFEKYVTSGKKHGTGLGAYSARLMARAQGGDIEFSSGEGRTLMRFKLAAPAPVPESN